MTTTSRAVALPLPPARLALTRPHAAAGLFLLLALPPVARFLESSMAGHMAVQIPLLVTCGILAFPAVPPAARRVLAAWDGRGLAGLALALITMTVWMLPRSLDGALSSPAMEAAKFVTVPLLWGLPLAWAWHRLGLVGRGVVAAHLVALAWVLGWFYTNAPARLCSNYLLDQQGDLGRALLVLGTGAALLCLVRCLAGPAARSTDASCPDWSGAHVH